MAENIQINKPAPYIESAGQDFLKSARTLAQTPRTATQLGVPSQAGVDPFSQQAQDLAELFVRPLKRKEALLI